MRFFTLLLLAFTVVSSSDEIDTSKKSEISRTTNDIVIDGILSKGEWDDCFSASLHFEIEPGTNTEAREKTTVFMTYDDKYLYIAFKCFDSNIKELRAHLTDREKMFDDDWVAVHLDTFHDKRSYLIIGANPLGVQMDGIISNGEADWNWDAIWESAGEIYEWGWIVEMAIPFDQIRLQRSEGKQTWGFDAWRYHPRSAEYHYAVVPTDLDSNCEPCRFLEIEGFDGIKPGNNIELNPTFTAVNTSARSDPDTAFNTINDKTNLGLTAKWGITNNIVATATLNPDFSQIEADSQQLDINTKFALYFAEKRPFFLEGNRFFSSPMINSYYSRSFRDPVYGAKIAGKEGKHSFGLMYVEDDTTNVIIPGAEFSSTTTLTGPSKTAVGRYQYDINDRYTIGAQFTSRFGEKDYSNNTYGFDGRFRLTDVDSVELQVLGSSTQYPEDTASVFNQNHDSFDGLGYKLEYWHGEKDWYASVRVTNFSEDFRADTGYLPQVDFVNYFGLAGYYWRPDKDQKWFNIMNLEIMYQYEETQSGEKLLERADLFGYYAGPMQTVMAFRYFIADQTYLGSAFDVTYFGTYSSIKPIDLVQLELDTSFGDTIDYRNGRLADRIRLQPMVTLNIGTNLSIYLEHHFERTSFQGEEIYTANISQTTWRYLINRRTMFRATMQYVNYQYNQKMYLSPVDQEYKHLFTQFIFSYKINPRTVLFLGYSDNYDQDQEFDMYQADYTWFAKVGYAWQL